VKKLKVAFALVISWLGVQEIAARILFPVPEIEDFNRVNYSQLVAQFQDLAPLRHAAFTWESSPDETKFVHNLNLYGFRDRDWSVQKDSEKRIAIVGDSFVEGFMAEDHQTIPYFFSTNCESRGLDIEVMNLGIGAAGIREYYEVIRDFVPTFKPDELIVVLYQNDIDPRLSFRPSWLAPEPEIRFSNVWVPRIMEIGRAISRGLPIPRAWHTQPFPFWPIDPKRTAPAFVPPRFAEAIRQGSFNLYQPEMLMAREANLKRPVDANKWRHVLRMLAEFLARHQVRLLLVYLPSNTQVSDYYLPFFLEYSKPIESPTMTVPEFQIHAAQLAKLSAGLGIPWLDLTPDLRDAEAQGNRLYWNYDEHMRATGYELVAARIFGWWVGLESVSESSPKKEN